MISGLEFVLIAIGCSIPASGCGCYYSFIGNNCCAYQWRCRPSSLRPLEPPDISYHYDVVVVCTQTVKNCKPCYAPPPGSCSNTITYSHEASTTTVWGIQGSVNGALIDVGEQYGLSVTGSYQRGETNSSSVSISTTYSCGGTPLPCKIARFVQKKIIHDFSYVTDVYGLSEFRPSGLRPDAPIGECAGQAPFCALPPPDAPNEGYVATYPQDTQCVIGTAAGAGHSEEGVCEVAEGMDCPPDCAPCLDTGPRPSPGGGSLTSP